MSVGSRRRPGSTSAGTSSSTGSRASGSAPGKVTRTAGYVQRKAAPQAPLLGTSNDTGPSEPIPSTEPLLASYLDDEGHDCHSSTTATTSAGSAAVQRRGAADAVAADPAAVQETAAQGVRGSGGALPHLDTIQAAFGEHDISQVHAHVGGDAAAAAGAIGAEAYATGDHVAFASEPDLHMAAHEAAHVVQQRQGVQLYGGVGQAGDAHEQQADAVADAVVAGRSAATLLGPAGSTRPTAGGVQAKAKAAVGANDDDGTLSSTPVGAGAQSAAPSGGKTVTAEPAVQSVRVGDTYSAAFHASGAVQRWTVEPTPQLRRGEEEVADGGSSWRGEGDVLFAGFGNLRAYVDRGEQVEEARAYFQIAEPEVGDYHSTRIHAAGFEDANAGVLYPEDSLRVEATVDNVGERADLTGRIQDSAGALAPVTSAYDPATRRMAVTARATKDEATFAHLAIRSRAGGPEHLEPLHTVAIVVRCSPPGG